jgi:hypothetical protein
MNGRTLLQRPSVLALARGLATPTTAPSMPPSPIFITLPASSFITHKLPEAALTLPVDDAPTTLSLAVQTSAKELMDLYRSMVMIRRVETASDQVCSLVLSL